MMPSGISLLIGKPTFHFRGGPREEASCDRLRINAYADGAPSYPGQKLGLLNRIEAGALITVRKRTWTQEELFAWTISAGQFRIFTRNNGRLNIDKPRQVLEGAAADLPGLPRVEQYCKQVLNRHVDPVEAELVWLGYRDLLVSTWTDMSAMVASHDQQSLTASAVQTRAMQTAWWAGQAGLHFTPHSYVYNVTGDEA